MWLNPLATEVRQDRGIPVAPGAYPVLGHLPALIGSMRSLVRDHHERLGPLFWIDRGFGDRAIMVGGEEGVDILRNKGTHSGDGIEVTRDVIGGSMIVRDGTPHRRARGASARPFSPRGLDAAEAGARMARLIEARVGAWSPGEVPVVTEVREMALDLIFRIMDVPAESNSTWRRRYEELLLGFVPLPMSFRGTPRWRARRARRWLDTKIREILARAEGMDPGAGLVASLVHGRDEEGHGMEEEELIDNLRLLLLAGHETTASVLAWMTFYLAKEPALFARLLEEVGPEAELPTTHEEMAAYPFAEGLFREALRLHPPVSLIGRVSEEGVRLFDRPVPAGVPLSICVSLLSRDPGRYPDPDALKPERWIGKKLRPGSLETLQFGSGPHFCLGYHLALLEGVQYAVALARSLRRRGLRLERRGLPRSIDYPLARPMNASVRLVRG